MSVTRTALITGASRGLGLALARSLAQRGWQLILDARNGVDLENARAELSQTTLVAAVTGDVSDPSHRLALKDTAQAFGGLDLLVNNAGILGPSPQPALLDYPLDILEEVYRVNVVAPLGVIQALRETLKPEARLLNITSDAAVEAYPGWGGYGSAKAALEQLSAVLAAENPDLRVFWVDPGDMRTRMQQEAFPGEDISDRPLPEESLPGLLSLIDGDFPSGRYQARLLTPPAGPDPGSTRALRPVLTVEDFEAAVRLYQQGLGLNMIEEWVSDHGRGAILGNGAVSIELLEPSETVYVDRIETGQEYGEGVRLAVEVADLMETAKNLEAYGAEPFGEPVSTPWGDFNQRFRGPGDIAITIFSPQGAVEQEREASG